MKKNTFIDVHGHFRTVPCFPRKDGSVMPEPWQLIEQYDQLGIEKAVILPNGNPECSYDGQSVFDIIKEAEKTGRFIPFCNVDPRYINNSPQAPLGQLLGWFRDHGCRGIGEVWANLPFLDPLVQNLFKHVEDVGMPLTFHISPEIGNNYGLYDQPGLPQLEESLRRFPKLKFFGHSQAFWAEIAVLRSPFDRFGYPDYPIEEEGRVVELFRKYPNLYGDLSANSGCNALKRDMEYATKFLNEFQDRLMFGTDICRAWQPAPLIDLLLDFRKSGVISEAVFKKIARENTIRLLEL